MTLLWLAWLGWACGGAARPPAPTAVVEPAGPEAAPARTRPPPSEQARGWYLRGVAAEAAGDAEAAERAFRWVVRLDELDPYAHAAWASWLERAGRAQEAVEAWEAANALDPSDPALQLGLGRVLAGTGREAEASSLLLSACAGVAEACEGAARVGLRVDDAALVEAALVGWGAHTLAPEDRLQRALLADRGGHPDIARDDALTALEGDVDLAFAAELAARAAERACDREPLWAWLEAARSEERPGEAWATVRLALARAVGDARVVEAEVARLERQGDPELALERASRALAAGDPARAGRILDAALAQRSQDARLLLARGDAALAAGDLARAEAAWAQVEGPRAEEARARVWVARALPAEEGALGEAWAARVACAATADEASCLLSALKPHPQLAGELERVLRRSSEAWPAGAEAALIEAGALGACDVDARLAALQAGGCEGSPEAVFRAAPGDARALDALIAWGERCGRLDPLWPARRAGLTDAVGP